MKFNLLSKLKNQTVNYAGAKAFTLSPEMERTPICLSKKPSVCVLAHVGRAYSHLFLNAPSHKSFHQPAQQWPGCFRRAV